ncbi:PAS domain-containing sensor histidine kinase [Pontibacter harenae]|uniref:PAS domain-containing sensor histidine kinase n=1 Tax=Pontibacter harenae TaxID=2894083 RepID=UPI001E48C1F1|nr:PAS domain S-box protein [Pontibacter harenae]MCC9166349.1 PAS domain S-box protein [Pontibacter harenae]
MDSLINPTMWEKMSLVSPDMFCTFDQNGFYSQVSEASKSIIGYSSDEMVGRHYTEFLHPDYVPSTAFMAQETLNGSQSKSFENILIHKDGHEVSILWSAVWSEEEKVVFCVARDVSDLKNTRVKLQESEHRYRTLFENNPDIIFIQNKEGFVLDVNQSFCDVFGLDKEAALNKPTTSFLPPEAVPICLYNFKESLLGNKLRFNMDLISNLNERRTYDVVKFPVYSKGEIIYIKTIMKDITEVIRSFETIQQQADKLNTIFESITDGLLILDRNWNINYINSEAEKLLFIDRKHHLGKNVWEVFPEQAGGVFHKQYVQALETGTAVHFQSYLGELDLWLRVKAFPSKDGLSVYFDDITELIKSRDELEKLSLVANKTNNCVLIADKDWNIEWVNNGFTRLMDHTLEEAIGKQPTDLFKKGSDNNKPFDNLEPQLLKGASVSFEELNVKKNGEEVWVSVDISPIFDQDGNLQRFIEVHTDITALKNSELELSKLANDLYRQNSDLQQFTYIVSHNLRSPVANALGLTYLLTKVDKNTDLFDKSVANLNLSVKQLDTVLKDMNSILAIRDSNGNLETEQVNINDVIQQVASSLQEPLQGCGGKLMSSVAEGLHVKSNKAYLYSIFFNLMSNAIKYRSEERPLVISIKCFGNSEKGTIISFTDNGSGFDMKLAKGQIFKLYKRFHTKRNGRGIGLFLVKTHLEAMGGHVEVSSRVGQGTKFLLYLPNS